MRIFILNNRPVVVFIPTGAAARVAGPYIDADKYSDDPGADDWSPELEEFFS